MGPVIACHDLTKYYGHHQVLKGIDLEVPAGTILALLGTNGAGKTTLIRTLLGLIPKSGGAVQVLGEEPYQLGPSLRQRIGYVSEEQGLYGWMRVAQIIKFCRSLYTNWDDALVNKYLDQFRLDPRVRISTLSKGQTVKLALILALAPTPELLILDEPMSGLDPLAQHEFLQAIMRDANLEGRTIFFSTHILADVEAVASQVAILHDGIIQALGPLAQVCAQVTRVEVKPDLKTTFINAVLLNEDSAKKVLLVRTASLKNRSSAELKQLNAKTANLDETFFFFCSGGRD